MRGKLDGVKRIRRPRTAYALYTKTYFSKRWHEMKHTKSQGEDFHKFNGKIFK